MKGNQDLYRGWYIDRRVWGPLIQHGGAFLYCSHIKVISYKVMVLGIVQASALVSQRFGLWFGYWALSNGRL